MPAKERQEPDLLDDATRRELLGNGEIELLGLLPYSSNRTFLARCRADRAEVLAVYKPAAGERPLYDFPDETLYRREVAACRLSDWLGWNLVPRTIAREGPYGVGSLQEFIEHDPGQHYFTLLGAYPAELRRVAFFDMLCNNADRKSGHVLMDRAGRIWAVDHGLTFHVEPKLRTVAWDFAGEPLPAPERRAAGRLAAALDAVGEGIARELGEFLAPAEVKALAERAARLCRPGKFPEPESGWSFPWPLV